MTGSSVNHDSAQRFVVKCQDKLPVTVHLVHKRFLGRHSLPSFRPVQQIGKILLFVNSSVFIYRKNYHEQQFCQLSVTCIASKSSFTNGSQSYFHDHYLLQRTRNRPQSLMLICHKITQNYSTTPIINVSLKQRRLNTYLLFHLVLVFFDL